MQRLRQLWRNIIMPALSSRQRLVESLLIFTYALVAILTLVAAHLRKAGVLFGRAADSGLDSARPEVSSVLNHLMHAGADFTASASPLVLALVIVYWGRRRRGPRRETPDQPVVSGPPFLF